MTQALQSIRLIPVEDSLLAAMASVDSFRLRYGSDISEHLEIARDVVGQTLDFAKRIKTCPPWIGYLTVDMASNVVVGCCAFKGKPSRDAEVEIAYFTFPSFERRGFAQAMIRELTAIASAAGGVARVIAHTLPERNASGGALEKSGFQYFGPFIDPEDGRVWRWSLELSEGSRRQSARENLL